MSERVSMDCCIETLVSPSRLAPGCNCITVMYHCPRCGNYMNPILENKIHKCINCNLYMISQGEYMYISDIPFPVVYTSTRQELDTQIQIPYTRPLQEYTKNIE